MPSSFIKPKEIDFTDSEGVTKTYILSKFPALDGREIISKYPMTALPKIGDYKSNEEVLFKLLSFVAVVDNQGKKIKLEGKHCINANITDWEVLAKIEMAMMEYNCSFFTNGSFQNSLDGIITKFTGSVTKILMDLLGQSSQAEKPL